MISSGSKIFRGTHKNDLNLLKAKEMQNSNSIALWIDVANLPEGMRELRNGLSHKHMGIYVSHQCCGKNSVIVPQGTSSVVNKSQQPQKHLGRQSQNCSGLYSLYLLTSDI